MQRKNSLKSEVCKVPSILTLTDHSTERETHTRFYISIVLSLLPIGGLLLHILFSLFSIQSDVF